MDAPSNSEVPEICVYSGQATELPDAKAEAAEGFAIETHGRRGPLAPHSRDFDALGLILKFVGACTLATSLLLVVAGVRAAWIAVATGAFFMATGYGLSSYKTWAWYAAAVVMPIFVVVFSLLSVVKMASSLVGFYYVPFPVAFTIYVVWVLFSKGGRARYRAAGEARRRAKANPDSIAGQLYRRR